MSEREFLNVAVSPDEKQIVKDLAKLKGVNPSKLIRELIHDYAQNLAKPHEGERRRTDD